MYKKIFLTILFTLVLSGGANADIVQFNCNGLNNNMKSNIFILDSANKTVDQKWVTNNGKTGGSKYEILEMDNEKVLIKSLDKKFKNIPPYYWYYATDQRTVFKNRVTLYDCKSNISNIDINSNSVEIKSKKIIENEHQQNEMMFTINDKREQCEAIGFKPETEKFADCVLRLVELDIKKQQQTQVTVAQNNGNDALVEQLQRQNDIQSSQALINLGQQLLQPKQFNSNIYMPQTQRCTVSGFGVTSVVRCY
jgi:hypothetical protein